MRGAVTRLVVWMGVVLFVAGAVTVRGSGFAIIEQSANNIGNAFAGATAENQDPSAIYFNAAGIAWLDRDAVSAGAHVIAPSFEFDNVASTPVGGGNGGDAGVTAVVPNVYCVHGLSDQVRLGFGVHAPFGLETEYDADWIGRFDAIKTYLATVDLNPTVAWKLSERMSVGAGVSAQYAEAELTKALPAPVPAQAKVEGDDWGYGYNLGLMFLPCKSTRIGLSYRSEVSHELEGDATFGGIMPATSGTADLDLPASAGLGLVMSLTPSVALKADVTWTDWSTFDELRIEFGNGMPDSVTEEDWEDTWRYAAGLDYMPDEKWTLRCGAAFDETPIPDAEHRTARIPDADRTWLALGAGYRASDHLVIDVGYVHLLFDDTETRNVYDTATGATLAGDYEGDADIVSLQVKWNI